MYDRTKNRIALVASAVALLTLVHAAATCAAGVDPATVVLAENGVEKLTRADYDAELSKLSPDMRAAFATDPRRVGALIDNLLLMKTLAAQARVAGDDRRPEIRQRIEIENARLLATIRLETIEQQARAEFDAKLAAYEARAREIYRADGAKYDTPEAVRVSQILFRVDRRGKEAAEKAARDALARVRGGADFAAVAKELSDDPSAKKNGGDLGWLTESPLEPEFAKAAFGLKNEGEVSEPVLTRYGYHVLRLEGRRPAGRKPFDEVKADILTGLRNAYIDEKKGEVVSAIRGDPKLKLNTQAMDAVVQAVDPATFALPLVPLAAKSPGAN